MSQLKQTDFISDVVGSMPTLSSFALQDYSQYSVLAECDSSEKLLASLHVLLQLTADRFNEKVSIDRQALDYYIAKIDGYLSAQMDEILHHPQFQALESLWRGLSHVVKQVPTGSCVAVEVLDVSKQALIDDFAECDDLSHSGLHRHLYDQEYDLPGGKPYAAIISNYAFDASQQDIQLLRDLGDVASQCHCPFIASVKPELFGKQTFEEVVRIPDLRNYCERSDYLKWNALRLREASRYLGLTFTRTLMRLPYGIESPVRGFCYEENVSGSNNHYLWGSASFAFASNLIQSFVQHGWCVNICGPESGGRVDHLNVHQYDVGLGLQTKIPTEICLSESTELALSELGFMPLCYYKDSDYACFFSANSLHRPVSYMQADASANARINARLPYVFLTSRIAHFLKVIQRENIGSVKDRAQLERELNAWLQNLVTKMNHPNSEVAALHPLREGEVTVSELPGQPGYYRIQLMVVPHFKVEGMDIRLSLVGRLPKKGAV